MTAQAKNIVIVGGGSAGWITAGLIAARTRASAARPVNVTVIEAPDIPIIGVGEGTWPSMRMTLRTMGINEQDFIAACHASFKQGSKFRQWRKNTPEDFYYHPFDLPEGFEDGDIAAYWLKAGTQSFSRTVCPQEHLCERHFAPKSLTSPGYAGFTNYGYHLDAGTFSVFLRSHATSQLGVTHIADKVLGVVAAENGDIAAVETEASGRIDGDLFIDCTGSRSLLLGGHYGIGLTPKSDILFADTALAVQVPYGEADPVQSTTVATAQPAGWVWDVSLSSRRGVGHVYSSNHMDEEAATECLRGYLGLDDAQFGALSVRKLAIGSGYRQAFWHHNCVAIGLSAGFLEPLEASALMLIETSANMVADALVAESGDLATSRDAFNRDLHQIWDDIIHFLKLHYCLSERTEAFWQDNRQPDSMPASLVADMEAWRQPHQGQAPRYGGGTVFPPASYLYVLYGMGFRPDGTAGTLTPDAQSFGKKCADKVERTVAQLQALLPQNRALLDTLNGAMGTGQGG
ncbi:tryptophan halogenase family protein [Kordiimonas lacus]|uniref:Tryptophan halogenase n=1 Tax=Kordiimonas lacus TaxID=637679 RepID=A0A1G6SVW8_9PROT|nr:tryptophan halogenase family protein [Kordiimonas lacus]SDD20939.1 Tryptophan halogenase [Kordiimonas lacus]